MNLLLRILASCLDYPDEGWHGCLPRIIEHLRGQKTLLAEAWEPLLAVLEGWEKADLWELQERYCGLFDTGKRFSLFLFEHIHGESKDRGQAMVDLLGDYERGGLILAEKELPDFLPALLEFCSAAEDGTAQAILEGAAPVLLVLHKRLSQAGLEWASVVLAVLCAAGLEREAAPDFGQLPRGEPHPDELWAEPAAFGPPSPR